MECLRCGHCCQKVNPFGDKLPCSKLYYDENDVPCCPLHGLREQPNVCKPKQPNCPYSTTKVRIYDD